jgi:hypothetical protein
MRARGMTYDTGLVVHGRISRECFDPAVVRRELAIIRDDLHCKAVQSIGGDPGRLELAADAAAGLGLEVWFSPYPLELDPEQIPARTRHWAWSSRKAGTAAHAERARKAGATATGRGSPPATHADGCRSAAPSAIQTSWRTSTLTRPSTVPAR